MWADQTYVIKTNIITFLCSTAKDYCFASTKKDHYIQSMPWIVEEKNFVTHWTGQWHKLALMEKYILNIVAIDANLTVLRFFFNLFCHICKVMIQRFIENGDLNCNHKFEIQIAPAQHYTTP